MRVPLSPPDNTLQLGPNGELDTARLARHLALATSGIGATQGDRYLHWDQLRHRPPPAGVSVEDWWTAAKIARASLYREFGLVDTKGRPFKYASVPLLNERLHRIDRDAAGALRTPSQVTDPGTRDRYLMSSLFEEAITSSQLEGASTTREDAKAMLRDGRGPANHSERMIVNNYRAMEWLRARDDTSLTPETVFVHCLAANVEDVVNRVATVTSRGLLSPGLKFGPPSGAGKWGIRFVICHLLQCRADEVFDANLKSSRFLLESLVRVVGDGDGWHGFLLRGSSARIIAVELLAVEVAQIGADRGERCGYFPSPVAAQDAAAPIGSKGL